METTNTIKGKEVIAYKYMNKNMCCNGFQYELGKSYKTDKVKINECGFHACLNPQDTFIFYSQGKNSRYFKVKLSGEIAKCGMWDTNVAATEITILEEMTAYEIINIAEWWKNDNVLDLLYFSDGLAQIINCERQYNFIGKDGKLLSDKWFRYADYFDNDGFSLIQREDGLQNYIDRQGNILSDKWFEWLDYFKGEFARVKRANDKYNYIDTKGKILSEEWFRYADYFDNDGLALIQREDGLQNYIDRQGNILSDKWFEWLDYFKGEFARVKRADDKYNYIDKNGKILSEEWFNYGFDFKEGFALVERINGESCKIDKTGKIVVCK